MRLIDADALKERAIRVSTVKEHCYMKAVGTHEIDKAPAIDAVEVVRCKDCEYKRELEGHLVCGDSMRAGMGVDVFEIPTYYFDKIAPDDFCSRGRRKDNG